MEFTLGNINLDDNGIVWMKVNKDTEFDVEQLDELYNLWESITKGVKRPFIIDLRSSFATIPVEFLQQMSTDARSGKWRKAEAILIDSLSLRIMAKFYNKLVSNIPNKVFTNEEEAIEWLKQF